MLNLNILMDGFMQVKTDYNMSFTTGGLLEKESRIFANEYFQVKDWKTASQHIQDENLFQYRTMVATKRIIQELKARFSYLNEDALQLIISGFSNETQQILWFAICQKHKFISDFVREVIKEKYFMGQFQLENYDFDAFYNKKMLEYPSLEKITDGSRYKLKQVLFKMLREVGMLNNQNYIQAVIPTQRVLQIINNLAPQYLGIFTN